MSLGWVFCCECGTYQKHLEAGDYNTLWCDHKYSETACVSDLTPDYDWGRGYSPDDKFEADEEAGVIAKREKAWREYHSSKSTVEICQCGKLHCLGITFKVG